MDGDLIYYLRCCGTESYSIESPHNAEFTLTVTEGVVVSSVLITGHTADLKAGINK